MVFFLNKASIASHFRSHSLKTEDLLSLPHSRLHVELGHHEKALVADDSYLKPFKSYKSVLRLRRIGYALTVAVVRDILSFVPDFDKGTENCGRYEILHISKQL